MGKIKIKDLLKVWFNIDKEEIKENISSISSLAPKVLTLKEEIDKIQPYLDKLKDTIETKGVNNIALTGGYGSGKSTIINTFKSLNSKYEYLNISLASFNKKKDGKNNKLTSEQKKLQRDELERLLEVSILQQIFYHVKPSEIPESRFKRIINIPDWKIRSISFGFILWVLSSILLLKYNYLDKINPINWDISNIDWFAILIFIIAFSGLGLLSKLIIKLFSNSQINKVNFKGELELGNNVNKSVFNEHLEEILYFFERTDFNVVIIEDLDRFDSTDIFTKLREINILLNNSKLISQEINFIYAVGDALFIDKKERVKFFEYIIPVIPFINSSNAEEQLMNLVKESELEDNVFSKEFLSDITTFIDDIDMRLLINIFHEFAIYRNVLKPDLIKGSEAELFAMITYKNLDPRDYDALNSNKGKLFELINNKKKYIEDYVSEIILEIQNKILEISKIESESINDFKELKSIYSNKVLSKIPHEGVIQNINFQELDEEEEFNKIINDNVEYVIFSNYNGHYYTRSAIQNLKYSFVEIEKEINPNYTYKERTELIKSKHNNKINLLKNELEKLRKKKIEVENWDLKQIFKVVNINKYLKDFTNTGLLRNLLIEGYINENYSDYISLFHEVSITKEDYTFERSVKGGYSSDFNYKLSDKVENLVEKIDKRYFEREAILNFDLLDFLGNNYNRFPDKYDSIIRLLSNEKEKSIQFIDKYIENNERPIEIFIQKLVETWKDFWDYIYCNSNFNDDKIYRYFYYIIRHVDVEIIIKNQNEDTLKEFIEQNSNLLFLLDNITKEPDYYSEIQSLIIKRKINLFEKLDIKFDMLKPPKEDSNELYNYAYNNNHYKINKENLLQLVISYGTNKPEKTFEKTNYSTILNSNCEPLIKYVNSDINNYVENVFLKLEQNKYENENDLRKLLNNEILEDKLKIKIIQKVETHISDLSKIEDIEIKKQLLTNLKVLPNWENVINYYNNCENKIDEKLVEYLNSEIVSNELSKIKLRKEDKELEKSFLLCNDINDEIYINLLKSAYYIYNSLNFEDLNEIKVENLVKKNLVTTKANYDKLKDGFANNHITLIERDFNKFFEKIEDFETDEDDILMILKSDKITIDNRFKYISKLAKQTIIDNTAIAKKVGEIIISKSNKVEFEFNVIESIAKSIDSTENKVKFINLYFTELSNDKTISLVKSLSHNHSELFVKQHKPLFNDNAHNRELLTKLRTKGLIKNFDVDKKDNTKIRAVANY